VSLEDDVRVLLDRDSIRDLVRRYAHHAWRGEAAGAAALFAADGVMDTGDRPALEGRDAILAEYAQAFGQSVFHPFVHNHVIEIDGDAATGTCYLDLRAVVDGQRMMGHGHYDDRYVRERGDWKFAYRKLNLSEFVAVGPAEESAG
jgi:uncharacterized protein (TIGR02246 family)